MKRKNDPIPVKVRGQVFNSVTQCAKFFSVATSSVMYHFDRGTLDNLGISGRPKNNQQPITIKGVEYKSRTEAYRTLGIDHQQFYKMLNNGELPSTGDYIGKEK